MAEEKTEKIVEENRALEHYPKLQDIQSTFNANAALMSRAASKYLDIDQLLAVALMTVSRSQKLLECTTTSLVRSIMDAAKLGLTTNSLTQEGHLVPFFNGKTRQMECQFMIGYKGLIKLAKRSKDIDGVDVQVVRENDEFDYELGLHTDLRHKPAKKDRGEATHVYAILYKTNGRPGIGVMSIEEAMEHGDKYSKSRDKKGELVGPWKNDSISMCMKTVLRQTMKYNDLDPSDQHMINQAIHQDELDEIQVFQDRSPIPEPRRLQTDETALNEDDLPLDPAHEEEPTIVPKKWAKEMFEGAVQSGLSEEDLLSICEEFEINSLYEATTNIADKLADCIAERLKEKI